MPPTELIPLGIILSIIVSTGIVGNAVMVIVFLKFKKLRSPFHYFITMNCLGDMFHNYGQVIFVVHLFGGFQIPQYVCYILNIPTLLGLLGSSGCMFSLGVDRLIACKWPIKYRIILGRPSVYIAAQFVFPVIYICIFLVLSIFEIHTGPVTCQVPIAMGARTFSIWATINLIFNGITILLYVVTYCLLKKHKTGQEKHFQSIFKSIFITVIFVAFGWEFTGVANTFIVQLVSTEYGKRLVNMYAGIPVNFACASNAFVFYTINSDYRNAINRLFPFRRTKVMDNYSESRQTLPPK